MSYVFTVPGMIRLVGDEPNQGRLEIHYDGRWGTVCHDHFDEQAGMVVCRQLGYTQLREFSRVNKTSQKQSMIWLDDISCSPSDVRLSQCTSRGWGITDCHYNNTVVVACEGKGISVTDYCGLNILCISCVGIHAGSHIS